MLTFKDLKQWRPSCPDFWFIFDTFLYLLTFANSIYGAQYKYESNFKWTFKEITYRYKNSSDY